MVCFLFLHPPPDDASIAFHHAFCAARGQLRWNRLHEKIEGIRWRVEVVVEGKAHLRLTARVGGYVVRGEGRAAGTGELGLLARLGE